MPQLSVNFIKLQKNGPASMIGWIESGPYMLYLKLFGGFLLVDSQGQPIVIESAKSRALLAYLALNTGRQHDRSQLAALLWGEQSESRARHSLTQALSTLSQTLQDKCSGLRRQRIRSVWKRTVSPLMQTDCYR